MAKTKQEINKKYRDANKEKIARQSKEYREKNKEKLSIARKKTYNDKKNEYKEKMKAWALANKEKIKVYGQEYRKINKKMLNAAKIGRKRHIKTATPSWSNFAMIKEIYRNCPEGYHVDHIIPLRGELVCGLHIEYNLQYLPASKNLSKNNSFEVF